MAFNPGSTQGSAAEINVTPLIDVLLVLLIIFMVIVPVLPRGMESSVPQASKDVSAPTPGPLVLEVRAQANGATDPAFRVDGKPVDAPALGSTLRARLAMRQDKSLILEADRILSYNQVVQTIAAARSAGAWPIGIEGSAAHATP